MATSADTRPGFVQRFQIGVERMFKQKPIEVAVLTDKWQAISKLYNEGLSLRQEEKPAQSAAIHKLLREVGLNIYYESFLGRVDTDGKVVEHPYFRVNSNFESSEKEIALQDEIAVHVFTFSRVRLPKARH